MHCAQIDMQREGKGIFTDCFGAEMRLHERGIVVDPFHEGVVAVPEATALSIGAGDGDV